MKEVFTQGFVEQRMKETMQTENQNVLEHGQSVWKFTKKIICGDFEGMKIPDWFKENHRDIVNNLHNINDVRVDNIYHDCGKPFCLEIDEDGKRHYPNHAQVSKETWEKISDNTIVSELISLDMMIHTETAEEIENRNLSKKTAFTLLVTALAELHSNCQMFGGIDSLSFKIKWKKWDKRGKLLMRLFKEDEKHPYSYVIVRKDIPNSHMAVQGTHAAIEYFKNSNLNYHPSIIYVVVKDEKKLKSVANNLIDEGIDFNIFRESMPPYNNEITAICTEPLEGEKRNYLKKFQLFT